MDTGHVWYTFLVIICTVAGLTPPDWTTLLTSVTLLAKLIVTVSIYVAYVQAAELFPTRLRVTGGVVCATMTSCFGFLTEWTVYTSNLYSATPFFPMTILAAIGAFLSAFLPETLHQHLPETVEDADDLGRGNKFWSLHPDYTRKLRKLNRTGSLTPRGLSPLQNFQPRLIKLYRLRLGKVNLYLTLTYLFTEAGIQCFGKG